VLVCKQSGDILLTEKLLFLYIIELQNIYVLVDLSSFNYVQIISMMLLNDVWMKCVELFLKHLNVSCGCDLNYAK